MFRWWHTVCDVCLHRATCLLTAIYRLPEGPLESGGSFKHMAPWQKGIRGEHFAVTTTPNPPLTVMWGDNLLSCTYAHVKHSCLARKVPVSSFFCPKQTIFPSPSRLEAVMSPDWGERGAGLLPPAPSAPERTLLDMLNRQYSAGEHRWWLSKQLHHQYRQEGEMTYSFWRWLTECRAQVINFTLLKKKPGDFWRDSVRRCKTFSSM